MHGLGHATLFVSLSLLAGALFGASNEAPLVVRPGGVVSWPGTDIEACIFDGKRYPPLGGACWYAIDLATPPGALELGRSQGDRVTTATVRVGDYPYPQQELTVDDSQVNLSSADLQRVRRESARIGALWSRDNPRRFSLPLASPLENGAEGGRFGARRIFNDQPRSPHTGADYSAPAGTPVLAPATGTAALTGDFFFSGKSVFLDHGDGLISMSFHLSEIAVSEGDVVERGKIIGRVGASGRATGPHLHFGLRWHGARIDPELLFQTPEALPQVVAP